MTRWNEDKLQDLLVLSKQEFAKKYGVSEGYVSTLKYRKKKELEQYRPNEEEQELDLQRKRELLQDFQDNGLPVSPEDAPHVADIRIWTQHSVDRETGEAVPSTNRYVRLKDQKGGEDIDIFQFQAVSANIRPTRRKKPTKEHEADIFVYGDAQIGYRRVEDDVLTPIHDERMLKLGALACRLISPDVIVDLSDAVDLPQQSRFPNDSDHWWRTLNPSFQRLHDHFAQLRADNPEAQIVLLDSNHTVRLMKHILKNVPDLYGARQANGSKYPVLSIPFLANLEPLDVEWVSGYGAAEFVYKDDIIFIHGNDAVSNGSTAAKIAKKYPNHNVVQGHSHAAESFYHTARDGRLLGAFVCGASCRIDGIVPGYHSAVDDLGKPVRYQEKWTQGFMWIRDYGDGIYQFQHIPVIDGVMYLNGKAYDVNDVIE